MKIQSLILLTTLSLPFSVQGKVIPSNTTEIYGETYCFYPNGVLPGKAETPAYRIEANNGSYPSQIKKVAILCGNRPDVNLITLKSDFMVPEFIEADGEVFPVLAIQGAFCYSQSENIAIHDNVSRIEEFSFQNASGIKELTLPAGLNFIGLDSFSGMKSLTTLCFRSYLPPVCEVKDRANQTVAVSTATKLGTEISEEEAAIFSEGITVKVPAGSMWIYRLHPCFANARLMEYQPEYGVPTLPGDTSSGLSFGYVGNGELALTASTGGVEIDIPSSIQSEDYQMGISMKENPYEIKYVAGGLCDGRSEVTVVSIPSSVISIGSKAFRRTHTASLSIPSGVHYIGSRAFADNTSLRRLIITRDEKSPELVCAPDAFEGSTEGVTLYVDKNLIDVTAAPWNAFTDIRPISDLH